MTLQIQIESYGAIQRYLPCDLYLSFDANKIEIEHIFQKLAMQFPNAQKALDDCACAVGDELLRRHQLLEQSCTLVLLSPVAGG